MSYTSLAERRSKRGVRHVNYNETQMWNRTLQDYSDSDSDENEKGRNGRGKANNKKNSFDYSESEYEQQEFSDTTPSESAYGSTDESGKENYSSSSEGEYYEEEETEEETEDELIVQSILGKKDNTEDDAPKNKDDQEYYVKFLDKAYIHCQWLKAKEIKELEGGENALTRFENKCQKFILSPSVSIGDLLTFEDQEINQVWFQIDRIIDEKGDLEDNDLEYLVKWKGLEYDEATWEKAEEIKEKDKIKEYQEHLKIANPKKIPSRWKRPSAKEFKELEESPKSKHNYELRDYQLKGLNWLRFCWYNKRNNILADEMGLGKTAQTVSMLESLRKYENVRGPFLVMAPLSTLPHWRNEFEEWSSLNTIVYHGNADCRELIRRSEFNCLNSKGKIIPNCVQFDVLVTNYETVLQDFNVFADIEWRYIIFDEAHKLKNSKGKLYKKVETLTFEHCTMLTGTPIQNNMEELWGLLHILFIDQPNFFTLEEFNEKYGNMTDSAQVKSIQKLIKPLMLRRKKSDVEQSIAAKEETIVRVELTRTQKKFYRALLSENASTLLEQITGSAANNLQNIAMQLRKVCNHPYLLKNAEDTEVKERMADPANKGKSRDQIELEGLVESSGKMVFISKLLPRLKEQGHKVLIFSQMVRVLGIISIFLEANQYKYERLDGSVNDNDRQAAIDRFNQDPEAFVFLLSTKAGGVGINLTAANTVIIYDSDWNPQNDIQAEARCHRIGQTQKVKVYRLVTRATYEEKMYERASKKLGLDHVVLDGGDMSKEKPMKAKEIEEMLRNGVVNIFNDDNTQADEFTAADIDQILDKRATTTFADVVAGGDSVFATAQFKADNDTLDMNSADFWAEILPEARMDKFNQPTMRRCRQTKLEMEIMSGEKDTDMKGAILEITYKGYTEKPFERLILMAADSLYKSKSSHDKQAINKIMSTFPPEEQGELEKFLGQHGVEVEQSIEKIYLRCAFFYRLRRILFLIQEGDYKWPAILPPWEDPVAEYALMLGVYKYGMHELTAIPEDKELGLMEARPLTRSALEKRVRELYIQLEKEFTEEQLNIDVPEDFKPLLPSEWKTKHSSVLARKILYDSEVLSLFQAMCVIGAPETEDGEMIDWERLRQFCKLTLVTARAVEQVAQQIIDLSNAEQENTTVTDDEQNKEEGEGGNNNVDLSPYDKLKCVQGKISKKDVRKVHQSIKEMAKIYRFVRKLSHRRIESLKQAPKLSNGPDWWNWECDLALIKNIAMYGQQATSIWIVDPQGPFRAHIPPELLESFEDAASKEKEKLGKGKAIKPSDQGPFVFLFRERTRIARAITVITYVFKDVDKVKKHEKTERKSKATGEYKVKTKDLRVTELGAILNNRYFVKKTHVCPIGYTAIRRYRFPSQKEYMNYKCEILSQNDRPYFKVTNIDADPPQVYESDDVNNVFKLIVEDMCKDPMQKKPSIKGNFFFGLVNKDVKAELSKLPGAESISCLIQEPTTLPFKVKIPLVKLEDLQEKQQQ
ncbi:SNF2 family N-terminal domain containing protein [Trichomonas vaginalis G3]|uniref:SNF2 family N-terminal domain containing protein n=1 Tax=Trichomonas vaginalis (strain ATCC PRA-98 / G3) TaxID=412133 RepID=A2EGL7_TRIV3|nr:helicase protein [Trichomonas vaginalis G3]EAY08212.1 SNF2 family N-terminal domain containing protein [Trichomonas vaginalis G3]KAI5519745.1 helicase protein [Trichomonas vaginalis G3]|eukprot:XP_001320435.1 SNF2 family N-terminal domain containing protein [Trichomonas vaginalis G3]